MIKINEPSHIKNIDFEILFGLNKKSSILIFLDELKPDILNYFVESDFSIALISKNRKKIEKARHICSALKIRNAHFLNYKKMAELMLDKVQYDFIIKSRTGNLPTIKKFLSIDGRICFLCQNNFLLHYLINLYFCKKNNFSKVRFFWPYPSNYNYIWIMPLSTYKAMRQFIGLILRDYDIFKVRLIGLFLRISIALKILKWIVPNYIVLAQR